MIKKEIHSSKRHPDAFLLDPPIVEREMTVGRLADIFKVFIPKCSDPLVFLCTWADMVNMKTIRNAATAANLSFCDNVVAELVDEPLCIKETSGK